LDAATRSAKVIATSSTKPKSIHEKNYFPNSVRLAVAIAAPTAHIISSRNSRRRDGGWDDLTVGFGGRNAF